MDVSFHRSGPSPMERLTTGAISAKFALGCCKQGTSKASAKFAFG